MNDVIKADLVFLARPALSSFWSYTHLNSICHRSFGNSANLWSDNGDSHAIKCVFDALGKRFRIHPRERLFMEVEISVPRDISDLGSRSGQVRVAEVVLKLAK